MRATLQTALVVVGLWVASGTALNLSRHPHWYVRAWDFPRPVVVLLALLAGVPYAVFFWAGRWYDAAFLAVLGLTAAWQLHAIRPYTPLGPRRVKRAVRPAPETTFRLVISNVLVDNRRYDHWLSVVRVARPDLVLALEVDDAWVAFLERLRRELPNTVLHPLDNAYGLALYSRLPLIDPRVEFLVQPDIPSVHTAVALPGGQRFWLHGLHPRPPVPQEHPDSVPRDAELMLMARRIRKLPPEPRVVAGDLNDVAWSHTTQLFLRESGLLDPRLGRGSYNTFNANSRIFRFPLDHVFHSNHFRLVELRRLPHAGSDHFPVLVSLSYEPEATAEQPRSQRDASDEREASELIERGRSDDER